MAALDFPSASLVDNVRFNEAVIVPNALQGLFRKRPRAVAAATKLNVDGQAVGLLGALKRRHGGRPVWVRVVKDRALLLLDVDDVRRALEGAPHPFAADPEAKRKGMAHFQPDALTISRGELWKERRRFTEEVLDRARALEERFVAVVEEEVGALAGPVDYDSLHAAYRRLTRRILLGDEAADDEQLSALLGELMSQANGMPSERSPELATFSDRMRAYFESSPEGSLAGVAAETPSTPDTRADGQLTHWMFATQDTLCINVLRGLVALAAHPQALERAHEDEPFLRASLQDAMRLWPTTPLLSRETLTDVVWHGVRVDAGTNVLISNTFMHRDPDRLGEAADRFAPERWLDGDFSEDWGINHFSHGPQGCPGYELALRLGTATLRCLLRRGDPSLESPSLDPSKPLPHMLDPFALRVTVATREES